MSQADTSNRELPTATKPRIALSLSGGGFRATLFHLGVIRAFAESGLLPSVTQVCSVSGGSVLAAHLLLNWPEYCPVGGFSSDAFDRACAPIMRTVRSNVRGSIQHRWPYWTAARMTLLIVKRAASVLSKGLSNGLDDAMGRLTATASLERHFRSALFKSTPLRELGSNSVAAGAPKPRLWILATNMTGNSPCYFDQEGFRFTLDERKFGADQITVAEAVSASAAFPGFFPAVALRHRRIQYTAEPLAHDAHFIADGGIRDNLGGEGVVAQQARFHGADHLVISDASGLVTWDTTARMGFAFGTASRTIELLSGRATELGRDDLMRAAACTFSKTSYVSILVPTEKGKTEPTDLEALLPAVRTDFDRFTDKEIACLVRHGYDQAWAMIEVNFGIARPKGVTLSACGGVDFTGPTKDATSVLNALRKSSRRRSWLFDWRMKMCWLHLLMLAVIAGGAAWGWHWFGQTRAQAFTTVHNSARIDQWRHLVSLVRGSPPIALTTCDLKSQPVWPRDIPALSDFTVVSEQRVFDLRGWRDVGPSSPASSTPDVKSGSFATLHSRVVLRRTETHPRWAFLHDQWDQRGHPSPGRMARAARGRSARGCQCS